MSAGNAVTPDYMVAGLQIGSWEEQQIVTSWFRKQRLEVMHPTDPTLSAGAVRYDFDIKGLRSLTTSQRVKVVYDTFMTRPEDKAGTPPTQLPAV